MISFFKSIIILCCCFSLNAKHLHNCSSKKFLIVANGNEQVNWSLLKKEAKDRVIIALDGAADMLNKQKIPYHIVLGDFDSIDVNTLSKLNHEKVGKSVLIVSAQNQDYTDLEKAIIFCKEHNAQEIIIYNASGDRLDHSEHARRLLKKYYKKDCAIFLRGAKQTIFYIEQDKSPYIINGAKGDICGFMAYPDQVIVSSKGLKWELDGLILDFADQNSVCNELQAENVKINIKNQAGLLIIMQTRM